MNRRVLVTMIREYKTTAFTPAFLFGVVLFPAIVMGAIFVFGMTGILKDSKSTLDGTIAIVDRTDGAVGAGALAAQFSPEAQREAHERALEQARQAIEQSLPDGMPANAVTDAQIGMATGMLAGRPANLKLLSIPGDTDLEAARRRLFSTDTDALLALIVLGPNSMRVRAEASAPSDAETGITVQTIGQLADSLAPGTYEVMTSRSFDMNVRRSIESTINNAIISHRMAQAGIDAEAVHQLSQPPIAHSSTVTAEGQTSSIDEFQMFIPMAFMLLLWISVMTGGQYLLMSTIEEKSSRVMEVLLSAISPSELLTGKIIGQGLVALTILAVYITMAMMSLKQFGPQIFALLPWNTLPWLIVYFVIGFGLFACLMAAIGSAVSDIREAQSLLGPIMMLLMFPWFLWYFIVNNPNSVFAMVLSYIPFTTPFVMILRISQTTDPVPLWQIITTTGVGVIGVLIVGWAAVKIFRIGVLMYGKPPSFMELLKWLRYG